MIELEAEGPGTVRSYPRSSILTWAEEQEGNVDRASLVPDIISAR